MLKQRFAVVAVAALVLGSIALSSAPADAREGIARRLGKGTLPPPVINTGRVVRTGPTISGGLEAVASDELRQEEADMASGVGGSLSEAGPSDSNPGTLGCSRR